MNFLAWLLGLTILLSLSMGAVEFFRASVCRQKAWLKSTELKTRSLLHNPPKTDFVMDAGCRLYVHRKDQDISWQRLPNIKKHEFKLPIKGGL